MKRVPVFSYWEYCKMYPFRDSTIKVRNWWFYYHTDISRLIIRVLGITIYFDLIHK